MAAQDAVVLENHLKLFVETKVGEPVKLEFTTGHVQIKPTKKHGSTTLGAFWTRVIQAYFPSPDFTYKKTYSNTYGSEVLTTVADGYIIRIFLRTGLVVVEGNVVYEWFRVIFRKVVQHYDRSTFSKPSDYRTDQYILDSRKEIQRKEKTKLFCDETRASVVDDKLAFISSDVEMPEINSRFADEETERSYRGSNSDYQLVPCDTSDVDLKTSISLRDGNTYVYPMWKQLLNKWLSIGLCKVYVCSRHMDATRYRDLSVMAYKNRLNHGIEAIYASGVSGAHMGEMKTALLKGQTADEQLFIEYRVLGKVKLATTKHISSNFIAGEYPNGRVELMITSADFDKEGLDKSQNLHCVTLSTTTTNNFQTNFLDKLATL